MCLSTLHTFFGDCLLEKGGVGLEKKEVVILATPAAPYRITTLRMAEKGGGRQNDCFTMAPFYELR